MVEQIMQIFTIGTIFGIFFGTTPFLIGFVIHIFKKFIK